MLEVNVNSELFKLITARAKKEHLPKSTVLYDLYSTHEYIYLLEEGICSLTTISEEGKEQIYRYFKSGQLICLIPAYLNNINVPHTTAEPYFIISAKSNCIVHKIYYKEFFELVSQSPELNHFLIFNLIQACRNLTHHFHNSQKSNAVSKLALTLLALSENTNEQLIVHKEFNYTELSKYLGVHHITITRIMSILKKEGVIEKKGHTILIIDKEQLLLYAHNKKTLQY